MQKCASELSGLAFVCLQAVFDTLPPSLSSAAKEFASVSASPDCFLFAAAESSQSFPRLLFLNPMHCAGYSDIRLTLLYSLTTLLSALPKKQEMLHS